MKILILLSVHLEEYSVPMESPRYNRGKSVIFMLYLICWFYILSVSFHTLPPDAFSFIINLLPTDISNFLLNIFSYDLSKFKQDFISNLLKIINKEEPFSGLDVGNTK